MTGLPRALEPVAAEQAVGRLSVCKGPAELLGLGLPPWLPPRGRPAWPSREL